MGNNDYIVVVITFCLAIAVGLGITAYGYVKRKKNKEKLRSKIPQLTGEEQKVFEMTWKFVTENCPYQGEKPDLWVVRKMTEQVPYVGGRWDLNRQDNPRGLCLRKNNIVFVSMPTYTIPNKETNRVYPGSEIEYFALVLLHELNHIVGYNHGKEMEEADTEVFQQLKAVFNW